MYLFRQESIAPRTLATPPASKLQRRLRLYIALVAFDCIAILSSFIFAAVFLSGDYMTLRGLNIGVIVLPIYLCLAINGQVYGRDAVTSPGTAAVRALTAMTLTMVSVAAMLYFTHASQEISRGALLLGILASALLLAGVRNPYSKFVVRVMGGELTNQVLILDGVVIPSQTDFHVIDARAVGLSPDLNDPYMLDRLGRYLKGFDRAVVACSADNWEQWSLLLRGANIQGEIIVENCPFTGVVGVGKFAEESTQIISMGPLGIANRAKKRLFDLAITLPTIVFLAPLLIIVAIAIKLDSPGPILFKQKRVGRNNALFDIYKFRSMRMQLCDAEGNRSASRDDERITRTGRFIRRTSIDELPQLLNVLLGDMSIVGPRPHALGSSAENKRFWEITPKYWCRHALKPGITGLAQIRGYRGATVTVADLENRLQSDLEYITNWSLTSELLIVLGTARVVTHKNAY